jgi:hypothetical protein
MSWLSLSAIVASEEIEEVSERIKRLVPTNHSSILGDPAVTSMLNDDVGPEQ